MGNAASNQESSHMPTPTPYVINLVIPDSIERALPQHTQHPEGQQ